MGGLSGARSGGRGWRRQPTPNPATMTVVRIDASSGGWPSSACPRAAAHAAGHPMPTACSHCVAGGVVAAAATRRATAGMAWTPCTPSPWDNSRFPSSPMSRPEFDAHHDADGEGDCDGGDAESDPETQHESIGQHVGAEEAQPEQDEQDDVRQGGETEDDAGDDVHLGALLGEAGIEAAEHPEVISASHVVGHRRPRDGVVPRRRVADDSIARDASHPPTKQTADAPSTVTIGRVAMRRQPAIVDASRRPGLGSPYHPDVVSFGHVGRRPLVCAGSRRRSRRGCPGAG